MKLNIISQVSLMVMAIAVNQSVYAMDDFLDEKKSQNKPVLIKKEACSEDWRQTYLKKKYLFSGPSLDVFRILVGIKSKSLSPEQAEVLLIEASQRGETDAQTKLYGFYTAPYLDQINLVDSDKAVNLLLLGVMQGQTWALMEASKRANSLDDKKKMHRQLADRGNQKSIEFLRNQLTKQQASLLGDPYTLAGIIYQPEASFPQKLKVINTFLDMCKKADYHEAIPPVLQLLRDKLQHKTLRGLYIEFAKQGAEMGNVWCMLELHSKGEDKDGTWLSKAAGLGDTKALELVDKFFFYEKSDLKTALKYAKQNAERGDIDSMDLCGEIYFLWEKFEKSLPYYLEVEKRGRAFAAYRIGDMYDQMGDEIKSMEFLVKAVDKGIGGAAFQIGLIYKRMENYRLSLMWLLKTVEFDLDPRNAMLVQIARGEAYQYLGNYQKALEHTEKAKSAGGYLNAGLLHNKLGNDQECERLWLKAARLNNLMAIENLAFFYFYKDNYASSLYWGKIAKSMGSQKAEEFLEKAEKEQKKLLLKSENDSKVSSDQEIEEWAQQMEFQLGMAQNEREETNKENIGFLSSKNEILHLPREKRKEGLNAKGLREKLAKVGLVYEEQTKRLEKAPLQMSPKVKPIAQALLSKKDDDVDFGDISALFSDPYFQERVLVSPTKSGCKVIAHDTANKSVLRAGTHKKHGQEKFTGKLHPAFREDLRKILKAFRLH